MKTAQAKVSQTPEVAALPVGRGQLALACFKIKPFRYLALSEFLGFLSFNTRMMVVGWIVLELTDSDGWVGLVSGLPAIPVILFALVGGTLADRMDRRLLQFWLLLALAGFGFLTGILVDTDAVQLWHLVVIAFPVALAVTMRMSTAAAMVVDVVGRDKVFGAGAITTAGGNLGRFIGPALGGWLLAEYGAEWAFYALSLALVGAAIFMWLIGSRPPQSRGSRGSVLSDTREGFLYIAAKPELRWLLVLALSLVAAGMTFPIVPRWTRDVIGAGAEGYGFVLAAAGVGGLIGAISLMVSPQIKKLARGLVIAASLWAAVVIAFSFNSNLVVAAILWGASGAIVAWWATILRTMFQLASKDEMRGRVMALFGLVSQTLALGWLVGGLLSELIGPQATLIVSGAVVAGVDLLAFLRSKELRMIGSQETKTP